MLDQFQDLTEAEQIRYFGTVITEDNEKHLADFALKRLKKNIALSLPLLKMMLG